MKEKMDERKLINKILSNDYLWELTLCTIRVMVLPKCRVTLEYFEKKKEIDIDALHDALKLVQDVCNALLEYYGMKKRYIVSAKVKGEKEPLHEVFIIGRRKNTVKKIVDLVVEKNLYKDTTTIRYLGKMFGYPKCCIDAFVKDAIAAKKERQHPLVYAYERYVQQSEDAGLPVRYCKTHKIKEPILPLMIITKDYMPELDKGITHIPCSPFCNETWWNYAYFHSWKKRVVETLCRLKEMEK